MYEATINITIGDEEFSFNTKDELSIDRDDLDKELAKQAALYAFFDLLFRRARGERARAEAELSTLDRQLNGEVRDKANRDKVKVTDKAAEAYAKTHPDRLAAKAGLLKLIETEELISSFAFAFQQRKDLIIMLARSRNQYLNQPSAAEVEDIRKKY